MLIPYLTVMFPAWMTMLLVAITALMFHFYHKWSYERQANGLEESILYMARRVDEINEKLVEAGLDPIDTEYDGEEV